MSFTTEEVTMYTLHCDGCGTVYEGPDGYTQGPEPEWIIDDATRDGWLRIDSAPDLAADPMYCPACRENHERNNQ